MAGRTMRTAVLEGVGEVTLQKRAVPLPGPGEVLVQVAAVGTCGSDVHYYEHGRIGGFVVESPLVLGHEPSGVVVAAGPGADRHELGQRVSIEPGVPDFTCQYCRAGRYNLCPACGSSVHRRSTARSASTSWCTKSSPTPYRTACPTTRLRWSSRCRSASGRAARRAPGRVHGCSWPAPARSAWYACRRRRPSAPPT